MSLDVFFNPAAPSAKMGSSECHRCEANLPTQNPGHGRDELVREYVIGYRNYEGATLVKGWLKRPRAGEICLPQQRECGECGAWVPLHAALPNRLTVLVGSRGLRASICSPTGYGVHVDKGATYLLSPPRATRREQNLVARLMF